MASSRSRSRRAAGASPETPDEQATADAGETPDPTASAPEAATSTSEADAAPTSPQEPAAADTTGSASETPPVEPGLPSADAEGSPALPETDPAPPEAEGAQPAAETTPYSKEFNDEQGPSGEPGPGQTPAPGTQLPDGELPPWVMTEEQRTKMKAREVELGPEKVDDLENAIAGWSDDVSAFIASKMTMAEPEGVGLARRGIELVKQMVGGDVDLMRVFVARFRHRYPDDPAMSDMLAKFVEEAAAAPATAEAEPKPITKGEHDYFIVLEDRVWWHGGMSAQARKGDRVCRVTHAVDEMVRQGVKMEPCDPPSALSYEERGLMPPPVAQTARPQLPSEPQRNGDTMILRKGVTGDQSGS